MPKLLIGGYAEIPLARPERPKHIYAEGEPESRADGIDAALQASCAR